MSYRSAYVSRRCHNPKARHSRASRPNALFGPDAFISIPVSILLNINEVDFTKYMASDSMSVNPVEADPIITAEPQPVFKDENLTVYGIPSTVHPNPSILAASSSAPIESVSAPAAKSMVAQTLELLDEGSNKRKRSPSPGAASKRVNLGDVSETDTHAAVGSLEE